MGFLWVTGFSFFHCVASPFHSFVTTLCRADAYVRLRGFNRVSHTRARDRNYETSMRVRHAIITRDDPSAPVVITKR